MANNRTCALCGKEYSYCPTCRNDSNKPAWYKLFDSENCKTIFNALNNYKFKLISKEEAQDILKDCDLTIELNERYRKEIDEIMVKPKRGAKAKINIIDEIGPEPELVEEVLQEIEVEAIIEPEEVVITE